MNKKILLAQDTVSKEDMANLAAWILTFPRLTKGDRTIEFEEKWAKTVGTKHAVFVNSGSSANLLMIDALIQSGRLKNKKVVIPALCWITDISPVIQLGLEPLLCDINTYDLSVGLGALEMLFQKESPACLMLVNILGLTPDMKSVSELCKKYDVILLCDNCEGIGSKFQGNYIETYGLMASCSLYYGHHLSCVEGGMITTDDEDLYNMLKMLRSHGWDRDIDTQRKVALQQKHGISGFNSLYTFYETGWNVRSTDLNAFIGIGQLDKLYEVVSKRNNNYLLYDKRIKNNFWKPKITEGGYVSNLGYPVIHPNRDKIVEALIDSGIEVRPLVSGSMGQQPFFIKRYGKMELPNASIVDQFGMYVPNHPMLTDEDIQLVCDIINKGIEQK